MDAFTCIYMYCNIERDIMKNQSRSLDFGILGKIFVYICFMFHALTIIYFLFFRIRMQVVYVRG